MFIDFLFASLFCQATSACISEVTLSLAQLFGTESSSSEEELEPPVYSPLSSIDDNIGDGQEEEQASGQEEGEQDSDSPSSVSFCACIVHIS